MSRSERNRKYPTTFPIALDTFLQLVDKAEVTLQESAIVEGEEVPSSILLFNSFHEVHDYERHLKNSYDKARTSLIEAVGNEHTRLEKLALLFELISEIDVLADRLEPSSRGLKHQRFFIKGKASAEAREEEFQSYYLVMQEYLKKCRSFIVEYRSTIQSLPQDELPLPRPMQPQPNASSINNPISFFEYLILGHGLTKLREDFKNCKGEWAEPFMMGGHYNEAAETMTLYHHDEDTKQDFEDVWRFDTSLYAICRREYTKTKSLIVRKIHSTSDSEVIKTSLTLLNDQLHFLLNYVSQSRSLTRYTELKRPLEALLLYLPKRFPSFTSHPSKEENITEPTALLEGKIKVSVKPVSEGFCWLNPGAILCKIPEIYETLRINHFISCDDIGCFQRRLFGEPLPGEMKIQWSDLTKNRLYVNRASLLYFINLLSSKQIIKDTLNDTDIDQKIESVFELPQTSNKRNWSGSKTSMSEEKKDKRTLVRYALLDSLVSSLQ